MTKVLINKGLLKYQRRMVEALRQVVRENFIGGVLQARQAGPAPVCEDLLRAPRILLLTLKNYDGLEDDFIGIAAVHDYGIQSMQVRITDDRGNVIESGDAYPYPDAPELWGYYPVVCVSAGTNVIVQANAIDCMGGVGVKQERKTISKPGG